MGRYLNALKKNESGGVGCLINLTNPVEVGSLGLLGTPPQTFEINHAANEAQGRVENSAVSFVWLIHFTDRDPLQVSFSPELNHEAALACYPDAVAAEPVADALRRSATRDEADELRELVATIYHDGTEAVRSEALQAALDNPDVALAALRETVEKQGLFIDDRRTCNQCLNLRYQICTVARPNGIVSAKRGYTPRQMWREERHRCEGYDPM